MIAFSDTQLLGWLGAFLLPMFRILALFSVAPVLGNRAVPVRVRVALAGAIAALIAPFVDVPADWSLGTTAGMGLVVREIAIGLMIGFVIRLAIAAFELAGEIIGLQMGLSFAGFFDPQAGQANAVGRLLNTFALAAFVALNGPLLVIAAILQSFVALPVAGSGLTGLGPASAVALGGQMFATAVAIALPFVALLLFVNLVLGVVSRVAPQFSVFSVGFPVTIGAGLVLLTVGASLIEAQLVEAIRQVLERFAVV